MEELFFQYGRYLLISSSRDRTDALPANLQGVWNAVDNPPWNADYHLNVNLQMNYWPAYMSNLAETAKPMINYIDDMRYYGRIAAKEYTGIESKDGQENGWWSILRQHHLAGLLLVGITIRVGRQPLMPG